jgi:hypothetical protein
VCNGIQQSGIVGAALAQEVRVEANLIFLILCAFGRDPVARRILAGEKLLKVMGLWQILLAAGWPNVYYAVSVGRLNFSALPTPGCSLRGKEPCVRWTIGATSWLQGASAPPENGMQEAGQVTQDFRDY